MPERARVPREPMRVVLAIDAGGTSTRAVLIAADGSCVGYGRSGGGNPVSWGLDAAVRSVAAAVSEAVRDGRELGALPASEAGPVRPAGPAVLAMAGSGGASTSEPWVAALADVGVHASVVFESDLLATFCAGTPESDGYAVVAGTGASAIRVIGGAVDRTADGLGWLLGDDGSGFWIGRRAVRAAMAELDGRGPATALSASVLDALGIRRDAGGRDGWPESLRLAAGALYRMRPVELARFAAVTLSAAAEGDRVAGGILDEAKDRLLRSLEAVHLPGHPGPVVLGGGIARRLPGFADAVANEVASWGDGRPEGLRRSQPAAVVSVEDGSVGAGVLALRRAGMRVDHAVFGRLSRTLAEHRESVPA